MDDLLKPIILNSIELRRLNYKKNASLEKLKLISLRKHQNRKDSIENLILSKRLLITETNQQYMKYENSISDYKTKDSTYQFLFDCFLTKEIISITNTLSEKKNNFNYILSYGIHLKIFKLLENHEDLKVREQILNDLLLCLRQLIYVKNEVIYEELKRRSFISTLIKYLHTSNNVTKGEVLLCIGHILSDVPYNNLKDFCAEEVIKSILILLEKFDNAISIVNLSFSVLISITRGKKDYVTKDCYRVVLRYLSQSNFLSLKDYLMLFLLFCEETDFIQYFSINEENYITVLNIVKANKESKGIAKPGMKLLTLLLNSAELSMIEKLINNGMLALFEDILSNNKNENLKNSSLDCLLYLSQTHIKIIRLIIEEFNLMTTLQKLLKFHYNKKRIVYEILFNIVYNGDYECALFLITRTPYLEIIVEYFKESLSINRINLHLFVNCMIKLIELDVFLPFVKGFKIKEYLIENGIMIELEKINQFSEKLKKLI